MNRPLIGVTVSEIRRKEDAQVVLHGEPNQTEMTLGLPYMLAVEQAGGLPIALSPLASENVDPLVEHLSGLLLTGGPDIDPACYGAQPGIETGPTDRAVDLFELSLCRAAYLRGMPILGICRGAQVLNVARQGTLHQHVPDLRLGAVEHRQPEPGHQRTHEAWVSPDSGLARATGGGPVKVNSFHHQAVDRLGLDLRPVAWAEDGLIEAVEARDGRFALGVQWHAETLIGQAEQLALFERLVEEARPAGQRDSGEQEGSGAHTA
jgi:putative glutamine amidotransferase